jgi:hypothetical protein
MAISAFAPSLQDFEVLLGRTPSVSNAGLTNTAPPARWIGACPGSEGWHEGFGGKRGGEVTGEMLAAVAGAKSSLE